MAKPDWGELQQRFLSDHAETGVSPKEWCEAQGLNYATARRYIKKPSAQTAQNLRRKMRTAQKDKSANELVDDDVLTAQQRIFVAEYLKDNNATAAAARAGYSDPNYGRQLITNPNVARAIAQQQKAPLRARLAVPMKSRRRCGSSLPSMQTSFRSIAAVHVATAGASAITTSGAMLLSSTKHSQRLKARGCKTTRGHWRLRLRPQQRAKP